MTRFPCTTALLASVLVLFGIELGVGAIGDDARLLALGALPDSGTLGGS